MAAELQAERINEFQRASASFSRKSLTGTSAASYYSQLGHGLSLKIDRLHRIAAEKLLFERNSFDSKQQKNSNANVLDLHFLTVAEARKVAAEFLTFHESRGTRSIYIVTGRGNHSSNGSCKLACAMENLLKGRKIKFSFDSIATFTINLAF